MSLMTACKAAGITVVAFPHKITVSKDALSFTIVRAENRTQVTADGVTLAPETHKDEAAALASARNSLMIALETLGVNPDL